MLNQQIEVKRERLYSGLLHSGARFHYVAYLAGRQLATADSRESAHGIAVQSLLDAVECASSQPVASVASDGTVLTTREYAPGQVEFIYHRGIDRCNGSMLSRCEVDSRPVTVREYHKHYAAMYEAAIAPVAVGAMEAK